MRRASSAKVPICRQNRWQLDGATTRLSHRSPFACEHRVLRRSAILDRSVTSVAVQFFRPRPKMVCIVAINLGDRSYPFQTLRDDEALQCLLPKLGTPVQVDPSHAECHFCPFDENREKAYSCGTRRRKPIAWDR